MFSRQLARVFGRVQDGPPPGGFAPINVKRSLPERGPPHIIIVGSLIALMGWGWYRLAQGNLEQREIELERRAAKLALMPYLLAEQDLKLLDYHKKQKQIEEELMKDVPGWVPGESVFKGKRYLPPFFPLPNLQIE
eukprot:c27319_g1_i1.p2 GENE.c27319_g1_i1~~c27319_g1_i1.p2  ORF type:complete len:136 (+),score=59.39 c27319_g1_i1:16-423(+)